MISLNLATFLAIPCEEYVLEALAESYARGLSPPTDEQRDRQQRQAAAFLIKTGKDKHLVVVGAWLQERKDVKSGNKRTARGATRRGGDREAVG